MKSPLRQAIARVGQRLEVYAEHVPEGLPSSAMADMAKGKPSMLSGTARKDVTAFAFGAHFVEVRVHARTREVRVARVVSAFAAGTIVNSMTAHSQFMGGAIWGLSSALHEETEIDLRTARYVNDNLADYLIPVNADVPDIEIIIVPENDNRVNELGIKGIGEIGIVGMNAAVANAVFNATGKRIRTLPIRPEKLFEPDRLLSVRQNPILGLKQSPERLFMTCRNPTSSCDLCVRRLVSCRGFLCPLC